MGSKDLHAMNKMGKIPPQATDIEEAVLGALMLEKEALNIVVDILKPESFYNETHRKIFEAIYNLYQKSEPVDILTVTAKLRQNGFLEMVGGAFFITNLTNRVASGANIEFHARIIQEQFYKREVIRNCTETITAAYDDATDIFELVDRTTEYSSNIIKNEIGGQIHKIDSIIMERLKEYEIKVENGITGVPSGFVELDRLTGGWQKSDLIIVAARPAMGKTAFALGLARNPAIDFKKPIALFSLEMSKEQLTDRLISAEFEIESETIRRRSFTDYEFKRMHSGLDRLHSAPIFIDDTPSLSILQFTTKAKKLKKDLDIQMIIIDYMQLMRGVKEKGTSTNREQEISSISRGLKAVAKELNIPVIALSQLSRAVENRPGPNGKRPRLADLRESGAIEQDADQVLFLYRPEYYGTIEDEQGRSLIGVVEVIIGKNRSGPTDTAVMRFVSKYTKFKDLEDEMPDLQANLDLEVREGSRFGGDIILKPSQMFDEDEELPF